VIEKSPELLDQILSRLSEGELVQDIAKDIGISRATIFRWTQRDPEFGVAFRDARVFQAHVLSEENISIADESTPETAQVDRLRVDTRKWFVSKIAPKIYGERVVNEITGEDGGPIQIERALVPGEAKRIIAEILAKAEQELGLPVSPEMDEPLRIAATEATEKPLPARPLRVAGDGSEASGILSEAIWKMIDALDVSDYTRAKIVATLLYQISSELQFPWDREFPSGSMPLRTWISMALKKASATRAVSARCYRLLHFLDRTITESAG
jgi:hypothetical protein